MQAWRRLRTCTWYTTCARKYVHTHTRTHTNTNTYTRTAPRITSSTGQQMLIQVAIWMQRGPIHGAQCTEPNTRRSEDPHETLPVVAELLCCVESVGGSRLPLSEPSWFVFVESVGGSRLPLSEPSWFVFPLFFIMLAFCFEVCASCAISIAPGFTGPFSSSLYDSWVMPGPLYINEV